MENLNINSEIENLEASFNKDVDTRKFVVVKLIQKELNIKTHENDVKSISVQIAEENSPLHIKYIDEEYEECGIIIGELNALKTRNTIRQDLVRELNAQCIAFNKNTDLKVQKAKEIAIQAGVIAGSALLGALNIYGAYKNGREQGNPSHHLKKFWNSLKG